MATIYQSASERNAPCLFAPKWGKHSSLIWQLVAAAQADELLPTVDSMLSEAAGSRTRTYDKVFFSLSLLRDVLRAGGSAVVRDSRLFVSWPNWAGAVGLRSLGPKSDDRCARNAQINRR